MSNLQKRIERLEEEATPEPIRLVVWYTDDLTGERTPGPIYEITPDGIRQIGVNDEPKDATR